MDNQSLGDDDDVETRADTQTFMRSRIADFTSSTTKLYIRDRNPEPQSRYLL